MMARFQCRRHPSRAQSTTARRQSGAPPCNLLLMLHSRLAEPRRVHGHLVTCRSQRKTARCGTLILVCNVSRQRLEPRSHVAADCRAVLDACISRVERAVPCRRDSSGGSAGNAGTEVAAVVASMVRRVEASVTTGERGKRRRPWCMQRRPPAAGASPRHPICAACERGGSWEGEGRTSPCSWQQALHE